MIMNIQNVIIIKMVQPITRDLEPEVPVPTDRQVSWLIDHHAGPSSQLPSDSSR